MLLCVRIRISYYLAIPSYTKIKNISSRLHGNARVSWRLTNCSSSSTNYSIFRDRFLERCVSLHRKFVGISGLGVLERGEERIFFRKVGSFWVSVYIVWFMLSSFHCLATRIDLSREEDGIILLISLAQEVQAISLDSIQKFLWS